ncbi:MAG: thioredoxin family protein [Spirochaetia bacterium]
MKIQILGAGCPKCQALERNAREAAQNSGINAEFEKVTDPDAILDMGVMMTPALAIDGDVKSTGRLLSANEIGEFLKGSD